MRDVNLWAICNTCRHKHPLRTARGQAWCAWQDWEVKHPGHDIEVRSERDEWRDYTPNADIKEAYGASSAYACVLTSLATTTLGVLLAGRESTAVSNTTNLY